jgi:hypothetical protein
MAFTPAKKNNAGSGGSFEDTSKFPVPRAGLRPARVSLIVDLGEQERPDFEEKDGTLKPQKPCQQVAVFLDLVKDLVQYPGMSEKQHYRIPINNVFMGEFEGINFQGSTPRDPKTNEVLKHPDGRWFDEELHPANRITKLVKAANRPDIVKSMDLEQVLDLPLMANIEVKITEAKGDKKDADGNPLTYKNVNYKGGAPVPNQEDDEGNDLGPMEVPELRHPAMLISFDNAEKDDIQWIRKDLRKKIKLALNYPGSNMQKAIEAFEAAEGGSSGEDAPAKPAKAPASAPKPAPKAKAPAPAPKPQTGFDDMDDDIPF